MPHPDAVIELHDCSPRTVSEAQTTIARLVAGSRARRIAVVLKGRGFTECLDNIRSLLHSFIQAGIMVYEEEPPVIDKNIPRIRLPSTT